MVLVQVLRRREDQAALALVRPQRLGPSSFFREEVMECLDKLAQISCLTFPHDENCPAVRSPPAYVLSAPVIIARRTTPLLACREVGGTIDRSRTGELRIAKIHASARPLRLEALER